MQCQELYYIIYIMSLTDVGGEGMTSGAEGTGVTSLYEFTDLHAYIKLTLHDPLPLFHLMSIMVCKKERVKTWWESVGIEQEGESRIR